MTEQTEFLGVTAYLRYPDGDAAAEWLTRVLGFGPTREVRDMDGRWLEGEIAIGPTHADISAPSGASPDFGAGGLLIVHVTDVDAQYRRILAAGTEIDPPKDERYGPRTCHVTDPWGYQWYFWQGDAVFPEAS
ncbi:MAG TPA: VOC family protein [Streptosporangiaceae bacterium]|jgi:uncharacterized glyoxalase superfamily protein PhnB